MAQVFISYVREDAANVRRLADLLSVYGINVWLDRDQLRPGYRWKDAIRYGIAQGDFFIACFSKKYSSRSRSFMNEELTLAIDELRQRPTDQAWFIPVLLSETEIPDRSIGAGETLRSLQWVSLYDDWQDGISRILSVIQPDSDTLHRLILSLDSSSARARIRAADSLGKLGPLASQSVPNLLDKLKDKNETVRAAVAEALGKIGIATEDVVAELLAIMKRAEVYYDSQHAASALTNLGALGVSALLEATTFRGYAVANDALSKLVSMGKNAVPHLIDIIDSDNEKSDAAIRALRQIHSLSALPNLVNALHKHSPQVRTAAIEALGKCFNYHRKSNVPEVDIAVDALVELLDDRVTQLSVIEALGKAGPRARKVIPYLITKLDDENLGRCAAEALGRIGKDSSEAVTALIYAVHIPATRTTAIWALGVIGAAASESVPTLTTALADPDVRLVTVEALGKIGPSASHATTNMVAGLDDPNRNVRWATAQALGQIGESAHTAVPKLIDSLENSDDYAFQLRVASALGKIRDVRSIEPLIEALSSKNGELRSCATHALGYVGCRSTIPALLKVSRDSDISIRQAAARSLGNLGIDDEEILNCLIGLLNKDDNVGVRRAAAKALAMIGNRNAIPALNNALNDEDELVRTDAQDAIDAFAKL